ncbi:hypothetical protein [Jeotgalibacillus sp. R-1-5s-1]|uniref:hypothetical protein n=1 Tax=Jeotgalibacillus sp. R-1-5s-1 TaxID=2555897 RepID=UPI001069E1C8|nr:hypothetical protein [Jeotgalibacillus sp. R-1-5s-1]TFD94354.1 hypothetical protein E2491_12995 [Jeotgalibacillus sp. R-1-5s-1]
MLILLLLVIPLLGVFWFVTLISILKNLKKGQDVHNQTFIGAVITFAFLFILMFSIVGLY